MLHSSMPALYSDALTFHPKYDVKASNPSNGPCTVEPAFSPQYARCSGSSVGVTDQCFDSLDGMILAEEATTDFSFSDLKSKAAKLAKAAAKKTEELAKAAAEKTEELAKAGVENAKAGAKKAAELTGDATTSVLDGAKSAGSAVLSSADGTKEANTDLSFSGMKAKALEMAKKAAEKTEELAKAGAAKTEELAKAGAEKASVLAEDATTSALKGAKSAGSAVLSSVDAATTGTSYTSSYEKKNFTQMIGDNIISLNRFENAFGPEQPHMNPEDAANKKTQYPTNFGTIVSDYDSVLQTVNDVKHWVKIAGKNGIKDDATRKTMTDEIERTIVYLDDHFPGAGFVFDGDNNEPDSAPFSQLIRALIVKDRIVMAVNKRDPKKYYNGQDIVSKAFVKGWSPGLSEPQSLPRKSHPNLIYMLVTEDFGKKGVTRDMVSASVFMGSGLQEYKKNEKTQKLTTGYTELLSLMYERSDAENSHELQDYRTGKLINKVFEAPMSPEMDLPKGTITVVIHEKASACYDSKLKLEYDINNMSASAVMEAVLGDLNRDS